MMISKPRTSCASQRAIRLAFLSLLLLLPLAVLTACGEEAAPPHAQAPPAAKTLTIVSTTPLTHYLVQSIVRDAALTYCLTRTAGEPAQGDLSADATMQLREADVVFMDAAELFPHVEQTVEANTPTDRIVRLRSSSENAVSVAPADVLEMIDAIAARLANVIPTNAALYQQRSDELSNATTQFAKSMTSQIDAIPVNRRTILTNDAQVAAVIRGLGMAAVAIDLPLTTHPTQADRQALLAAVRQSNVVALAIDARESETIRELLADVARETGAKIITPTLSPWPADSEDYVAWMSRNLEAVAGALK